MSTRRHANAQTAKSNNEKSNGKSDNFATEHITGGWRPGMNSKVDDSGHFEFGGSAGTLALMLGFPTLMYYMWIGTTYYDGQFPLPRAGQSWREFGVHLAHLVHSGAFPHLRAWRIYWAFYIFEAVCYVAMPGFTCYGKPLPHEGGKQLKYHCSAYTSFYLTIAVMAILHGTGLFAINTFLDEFGPLLSVSIISGFLGSFFAYFSAFIRGRQHRITGRPIYDFFMGAELNPRLGLLDFKMLHEVRIPWFILFGLTCAAAARQHAQYGSVPPEILFLLMAHFLYANACAKAEQFITTTWDMYQEKMGFLLTFWNMSGVPLSYSHATLYLANRPPESYAWNKSILAAFAALYLFVYWIWDTANSQKNSFRMIERGTFVKRSTFPQLPWQELHSPKTIAVRSTNTDGSDGSVGDDEVRGTILVDGWYALARKIHYSCDMFFAFSWAVITGFESPFPWFYPVFFAVMIAHRTRRDTERCRVKYGEAWMEYERLVPWIFIPYVF